ncbi:AraC family transcriptional regulator [Paenibacillus sacheonensis]|uniref:Helix-turn-helix domain-containing protein n=1 Tax=Paenibacillus sacheonensis TaxID=742054 RepID=A0A7X4YJJ2_9BACL|nr:helix-turn-helix domain-containing protein [Paenibacillus sacheonensis]MBM7564100.1 AraC-like DNA-binding protein [Paenibacillus sacheonensis]NBC67571.1 helix-turn-helix domain-containing protein [Paenibacillus sacheonensis]
MRIRICKALTISDSAAPAGGIHADNLEILYITKGRARFQWAGHCLELHAPAVFLIAPSTPHVLESLDPEIGCIFLELSEADDPFLTTANIDRWNLLQAAAIDDARAPFAGEIERSLQYVHRLFLTREVRPNDELEQVCLLELNKIIRLIAHILRYSSLEGGPCARSQNKWSPQETIDILIDFMEWRYSDDLTLDMLAELVHLNPSYLVRIFKKHTGRTPFEYLQTLRLKAAVSYLLRSELPLRVIAEKTGFNSIHYFCRLFRKTYGDSPIRWRDKQAELAAEN